ncbi:MAG: TolC family protein [Myxococcales bacterium]|jgi:outer membrane protein
MRISTGCHAARLLIALGPLVTLLGSVEAHAQQPLSQFLSAARTRALDVRQARAALEQARSQTAEARGRLLPNVVGQASYQRNSPVVAVTVPTGMVDGMGSPVTRQAVITPADQYGAVATATVPLIDLAAWNALATAGANADAAEADAAAVQEEVTIAVVELWYRLVGQRALVEAAERNLAVTRERREATAAQVEVGVAGQLELSRAEAELARAKQTLTEAQLQATLSARGLQDLTGLAPDASRATVEMGAGEPEPALDPARRDSVNERPAVRAARARERAADIAADGAWLSLLPTVAANGLARWNNAAGFGQKDSYYLGVSATWTLDFVKPARVGTAAAALDGAEVASDRAQQQAATALFNAWQRVKTSRASVEASLAAQTASQRAVHDAEARYQNGAATQLDLIAAQRDAFQADVAVIQAVATLHVARAVLGVRSGGPPQ